MSTTALFAIGSVVFFVAVFGVVMVGSLTLVKVRLNDDPMLAEVVDDESRKGLPTDIEY